MTPEEAAREARLPKWARDEMVRLRRCAADANRERDDARLTTNPADSDTVLDAYSDIPIGLGKGPTVRFRLGESDGRQYVDARIMSGSNGCRVLQLMTGELLHVEPRSANVIHVGGSR